jgi:glucose-1-phosphate adenylyltransferase
MRAQHDSLAKSLDNVLAVILGGGRGTRLFPLTRERSKPAVPIAGKYRLIDIPISNCINSGIYHIGVLTQFNSVSLHRHITQTYNFDSFHKGWVQVWAAEQTLANADWYQGTADAVRKQIFEIKSAQLPYVLVLAGDHLYRMDYAAMARFHWEMDADITIAVQPVAVQDTGRFGILKRNQQNCILDFAEKPVDPTVLEKFISRDDDKRPYLGSMGIYLFKTDVLISLLENITLDDFGKHVIPHAIHTHKVAGFDFDGYWEDIGTFRTFFDTNLALTDEVPVFSFFDPERPIYSNPRFLPSSTIQNSQLSGVVISEGCRINNAVIKRAILGLRTVVGDGASISNTIVMGSDYYEDLGRCDPDDYPTLGIGCNSQIVGAIIDKNARIGNNVTIGGFTPGTDLDGNNWVVRDGIVVIPKNAVITHGTVISPS